MGAGQLRGLPMTQFDMDIAIIGAGVVGLAILAELTKHYEDVFVFEKNETVLVITGFQNYAYELQDQIVSTLKF